MNATTATPFALESTPVITWQQQPVVTTDLLALWYGTDPENIRKNFSNNASRFIDGKHFIKLEGEALREFKHYVNNVHVVEIPRQTRHFILWTERGAARHAKMLDTEQAWEVFEKLEDCYFSVKAAPAPVAIAAPETEIDRQKRSRINRRALELSHHAYETYRDQMMTCHRILGGLVEIERWLPPEWTEEVVVDVETLATVCDMYSKKIREIAAKMKSMTGTKH